MRDRDDLDFVFTDPIDEIEWELDHDEASPSVLGQRVTLWRFSYPRNGMLDLS